MFIGNDNPVKKRFSIFDSCFYKNRFWAFVHRCFLSSYSGVVEIQIA